MARFRACLLLTFVLSMAVLWAGDRSPSPDGTMSSRRPDDLRIELQTEPHTCGFHTLSSIYRAHALDPTRFRLRERLGVDVPAIPTHAESTGTLQPDMMRVLHQDGFLSLSLDPLEDTTQHALVQHFDKGHYAAACIKRRENGHWHWVILSGMIEGQLLVGDSLRPEGIYQEPYEDFMQNHVLDVLTIVAAPMKPQSNAAFRWHAQGWRSLLISANSALPVSVLSGVPLFVWAIWTLILWRFSQEVSWRQSAASVIVCLLTLIIASFFLAYSLPLGFTLSWAASLSLGSAVLRRGRNLPWCQSAAALTLSLMATLVILGISVVVIAMTGSPALAD